LRAPFICKATLTRGRWVRRIGTCRKKVMGLLRLMGNKADVVKGLSKRCNENWSVAPKSDIVRAIRCLPSSFSPADFELLGAQGLYLSDIQDHITTSTQNLTHYEKILSRSHSNYLAQISIEMCVPLPPYTGALSLTDFVHPGPTPTTRSTTCSPSSPRSERSSFPFVLFILHWFTPPLLTQARPR
jgi:hypothetical protein